MRTFIVMHSRVYFIIIHNLQYAIKFTIQFVSYLAQLVEWIEPIPIKYKNNDTFAGVLPLLLCLWQLTDQLVKLSGAESVVGRSFVIHAKADDLGASGDQAGNAGIRVACCTIYRVPTPAQ